MSKQIKITNFFKKSDSKDNFKETKNVLKSNSSEILSPQVVNSKKIIEKKVKICPFYKKIPRTSFAVDAFSYGQIENILYYFLSHFHSDHYNGLKKNFNHGKIICSSITGRLIMSQIGVDSKFIQMIEIHQPIIIDGIKVIGIDANHCPGSVMFLFIFPNGHRILHTGDFRANQDMGCNFYLIEGSIDCIYLDTTYLDPRYNFPKQNEIIDLIIKLTQDQLQLDSKTLIICGSYTIGKEKVFQAIAQVLNLKIWVSSAKLKLLNCFQDENLNKKLINDKSKAQIHVLPMHELNFPFLKSYLNPINNLFTSIIAFKPTGWEQKCSNLTEIKPRKINNIIIYGLPYSEHSSFDELKQFVQTFKAKSIIPTVHVGSPHKRQQMMQFIKSWTS